MITTTTAHDAASRAAALFLSTLSVTDRPTYAEVAAAIDGALRRHGGGRGCAADGAAAFGDHPELAPPRTRRARRLAEGGYQPAVSTAASARTPTVRDRPPDGALSTGTQLSART